MNASKRYVGFNVLNLFIMAISVAIGTTLKSKLPEMSPVHFDAAGLPTKFESTANLIISLPITMLFVFALLTFLVKRKKDFFSDVNNQEAIAQTNVGITLLFFFMHLGKLLNAVSYADFGHISFFAMGFGAFFVLSALPMKKLSRNTLYGIRVPWSLKSDANWRVTHDFAAKMMLPAGILLFVASFFTKSPLVVFTLISVGLVLPMFYSYNKRAV